MVKGRTGGARVATRVGSLGLVAGAATTLARYLPDVPGVAADTWAMVLSFSDAGALAYGVALVGLLTGVVLRPRPGRVVALGVAAALTALHLSWIVPAYVPDGDRVAGTGVVRVLSQNTLFGGADPDRLLGAAASADVLVLTELTTSAAAALQERGVGATFGYQSGGPLPDWGATGTRVYSRYPLRSGHPLDVEPGSPNWVVQLDVPEVGPLTLVAVHPQRPVRGHSAWRAEQERIRRLVPHQRTIVAGDFNAVDSHPALRRFGRDGFRDSDGVVGAGWQPTYPAQGRVPPLIAIDHVLLSADLTATAFRTVPMAGSDHRGVLATVATRG